ncbi:PucR family transcriptional regulator [Yinghuangia soli]|uniref:Helix-turn-helix domain-containing protein n=1 Tax=Yinghuangia soli TaxID=2908204 RepID=A0AA41U6I0_9ACTN|nr:PucR family transcriptional regulator [Yinghuangia soli]MCF2533012.1 helix-turn-helix domain-containing protein [Yinghuangia soli]
MRKSGAPGNLPVRQLVDSIGPALLRLVQDGTGSGGPLTDVAIHAPGAPTRFGPGCVVLGVGVTTEAELRELTAAMRQAGAEVLAVKAPVPPSADDAPAIIEVNRDASWMHVATTVREQLLADARTRVRSADSGAELFALANAVYEAVGAPVTIEDRFSALVAWSQGQDRTDSERIETILGRAVHQRTLAEQRERQEFERLHASTEPVYMAATGPDQLARVAIAVRAGSDVLGYIWAAVTGPLDDAATARLREFAPVVALQLVGLRTETSYARRQRGELAAAVLGGAVDPVEASRLQLGSGPVCVLAAAPRSAGNTGSDARDAAGLRRFADTLEYFLAAVHPRSAVVAGTGVVYVLAAWPAEHAAPLEAAAALARDFLARTPLAGDYVVAVGGPAESTGRIAHVRAQADAALRALRHPAVRGPVVRTVEDMALSVLLLHLADASEELGLTDTGGALQRLRQEEGEDGPLAATLAAYLAAAGATDTAAEALHIHPNTMRYRLRRIREVSGLDFADADAMLLAHLRLRVRELRTGASQGFGRSRNDRV